MTAADRPPVSGEPHVHVWKREYAPNYRQASEADDWREKCACGAFRSGTDRPPVSGEPICDLSLSEMLDTLRWIIDKEGAIPEKGSNREQRFLDLWNRRLNLGRASTGAALDVAAEVAYEMGVFLHGAKMAPPVAPGWLAQIEKWRARLAEQEGEGS